VQKVSTKVAVAIAAALLSVFCMAMRAVTGTGVGASARSSLYAAPAGTGAICTLADPCSITTAHSLAHGNATIYLEGDASAPYHLASTLAFTGANSGETWTAAPGATPLIVGSVQVTGWTAGADAGGGNTIWNASVTPGTVTRQLYVNGNRATRARNPNINAVPIDLSGYANQTGGFSLDSSDPNNINSWSDKLGLEFSGTGDCLTYKCRASAISDAGITIEPDCWASANNAFFPWSTLGVVEYENAIELLDAPGEWFLSSSGTLSYIPNIGESMTTADVELPVVQTLMSWVGTSTTPITGATVSNISFAYNTWTAPTTATAGFASWCGPWYAAGGVANPLGWNAVNNGYSNVNFSTLANVPAALDFQWTHGFTFSNNQVSHTGSVGVFFHNGTQSSTVASNWFYDSSDACIVHGDQLNEQDYQPLAIDAGALGPKNNVITNNVCEDFGKEYWSTDGIAVHPQASPVVTQNSVFHGPALGISLYSHAGADDPDGGNAFTTPTSKRGFYVANNDIQYTCAGNQTTPTGVGVYDCGELLTSGWDLDGGILNNTIANQHVLSGTLFVDQGTRYETITGNCVFQGAGPGSTTWFMGMSPAFPGVRDSIITGNYTDYPPPQITPANGWDSGSSTNNVFSLPSYVPLLDDDGGSPDAASLGACGPLIAGNGSTLRGSNLAYAKPASSNALGNAQIGNDGNVYTVLQILTTVGAYWQVDLGAAATLTDVVYFINVANDTSAGHSIDYRSNLRIDVSNDPSFGTYTTIGTIDANGFPNFVAKIMHPSGVTGRYVRVTKTANGYFAVSELFAYGH
jgi:hypothetical protein